MFRRLALGLIAIGLFSVAAPAFAQPPTTDTTHENGLVETFVDVIPSCDEDGAPYTITTTSNLVEHETVCDLRTDGHIRGGAARGSDSAKLHRSLHATGRLQPEREHGERHVHLQSPRHGLGRIDRENPSGRSLQRTARRQRKRVLPLPLGAQSRAAPSVVRAGPDGAVGRWERGSLLFRERHACRPTPK
jgi:hypothetical protein